VKPLITTVGFFTGRLMTAYLGNITRNPSSELANPTIFLKDKKRIDEKNL
jgi:hypothetical protein